MKTERNAVAKIKNFTPLMDDLVKSYGIVTAAVWGRIWRYAQQENGVCQAAQDKIADELKISRRTIVRHIKVLVKNDYLKDYTPDLVNKPHTYGITSKARILITVEGVTESHSSVTESHSKDEVTVTESHTGVTESHSHCDRESQEETIKKQFKKQYSAIGEIPEPLRTQQFTEIWGEWCKYRVQSKKPLTEAGAKMALKMLAKYPAEVAGAMIEQSIANGWQGIFEVDEKRVGSGKKGGSKGTVANADGSYYG